MSGHSSAHGQTQVLIHDISETGLLLESTLPLAQGEQLDLELPGQGTRQVTIVWSSGRYFGCRFAEPLTKVAIRAAAVRGLNMLPKKGSPQAVSLAESQLRELSFAIDRIGKIIEKAIAQLSKRDR